MRCRTIHVSPLSAPTVTAPVASTPMAGADGNHDYLFAIYERLRAASGADAGRWTSGADWESS